MATGPNKIRLSTNPTDAAIAALQIGDIVYLDGTIYTAREGVYMRVIEDGVDLPLDLPAVSAANFHCSPAVARSEIEVFRNEASSPSAVRPQDLGTSVGHST